MPQSLQVVWFKRDLRVWDHRPLALAAERGPVLPLYIVEPEYWQQPDSAGRHWRFVAECLRDLRADLATLGRPLILRTGPAVLCLDAIHKIGPIAELWSHEETGNGWTYERDKAVAAWARSKGIRWTELPSGGVVRRLRSRNGWAKRWHLRMTEEITPPPAALEPLPSIDVGNLPSEADLVPRTDTCPQRQLGGRRAALTDLQTFLEARGETYRRAMSNPSDGALACSRLSAHLAWGSLSSREVAQATWRRKATAKGAWRASLRSFESRLHWRDHFIQKLEDAPDIEWRNLHQAYDGLRAPTDGTARLSAWSAGETGLPFVDATMRCLAATGWMNFRMRAMLVAVASYHLWLDWRGPGEHLARLFTDYEPGIHWSQMQMQSGTTGINTVRIYNPVKQGHDQDPDGSFTRCWLPELASVPDAYLQQPWRWEGSAGLLGKRYPFPIVDHLAAAKVARQRVWALRGSTDYRQEADAIQDKHGSRKSGIPRRGAKKQATRSNRQLALPLATNSSADTTTLE